jgi:phosphoglycolate phosphatase-like HAD superfamily hydrolase
MRLLLAVDSDGCALDAMESKHRLCFGPATIDCWGLENCQELAFDLALHINLYSRGRGLNRFLALREFFVRLPSVCPKCAGLVPDVTVFDRWIAHGGPLSEAGLKHYMQSVSDADEQVLRRCLEWNAEVNRRIAGLTPPKPFPGVQDTLKMAHTSGAVHVVSSANRVALEKEWKAARLLPYVEAFHPQESGSKADVLSGLLATAEPEQSILMVGDAWADLGAAKAAKVLFFPIVPMKETASWRLLRDEVLPALQVGWIPCEIIARALEHFQCVLQPLSSDNS